MVIENDPSARMQVRSRGELVAPASCAVCGNGNHEAGYLDLGVFVDFFGTIYLCMTCITQGAETVGMYTPDEVRHLQAQVEGLITDRDQLASELNDARSYIANFDDLLRTKFSAERDASSSSSENVQEVTERPDSREPVLAESVTLAQSAGTSGTKLRDITFD